MSDLDLPPMLDRRIQGDADMAALSVVETMVMPLPALVDRARDALTNARGAAEILDAQDMAGVVYDAAKKAARLGKAKKAHDELIAAAYRVQADALEIDAQAKRRLADEYDAAQERGEVATDGRPKTVPDGNGKATAADIGLSRKQIHEARSIRDAEKAEPGIIRRALDELAKSGREPTRAEVKRVAKSKSKRTRGPRFNPNASGESQHDRDLRMLLGVWEGACESAQAAFLEIVTR